MGLKHLASTILLLAGFSRAYVDDETTRSLLGGVLDVDTWIATNEGLIGSSHRHGGGDDEFPYGPGIPGAMTDSPPNNATSGMKAYCFEQPISHFDKSINGTFCQRYWVAAPNYKPGGPIFLFDSGEGAGDGLAKETANPYVLAKEHNGIFIVLEHRYYGWSVPVPDLTTDNLRFLNNKEALQDSADFIAHWQPKTGVVPGLTDPKSVAPSKTPWLYYSGSYPGARAAHMRTLFPDLVYAAIASSAVVVAKTHYYDYWNAIHAHGGEECVGAAKSAMKTIDDTLDLGGSAAVELKTLFGCEDLSDVSFAKVLRTPLSSWQNRSWRWSDSSNKFLGQFCPAITADGQSTTINGGKIAISAAVNNWAGYVKANLKCNSANLNDCYGTRNDNYYSTRTDVKQTWRLWLWQVCTEWGYQTCNYEDGRPSMLSKRLTYEDAHNLCKQSFAPGKFFSIPDEPNVDEVNSIGGYSLARDRLAFIDGEADPWREVTVHSALAEPRDSTDERPVYLIPGGVHVYDLWTGDNPPKYIQDTQTFIHGFVKKWLDEWKESRP